MTHRFALPTEDKMENLITQVFELMPNADQSKLSLIESRLLKKAQKNKRQKNLNKIPWWIVLLLAGGFATAAWWAGELFIDKQYAEMTDKQLISSDKMIKRQSGTNGAESNKENNVQNNKTNENKDSPIIYQRESF